MGGGWAPEVARGSSVLKEPQVGPSSGGGGRHAMQSVSQKAHICLVVAACVGWRDRDAPGPHHLPSQSPHCSPSLTNRSGFEYQLCP